LAVRVFVVGGVDSVFVAVVAMMVVSVYVSVFMVVWTLVVETATVDVVV